MGNKGYSKLDKILKQLEVASIGNHLFLSIVLVVYNCFFVETGQATTHQCDVISHSVWKNGTWVTAGGFPEWGGVLCWPKEKREKETFFPLAPEILHSNPRPIFSKCMWNDVMSVCRCLTSFRKKQLNTVFLAFLHLLSIRMEKRKNPEKWPDEKPIYAPLFVLAPIYAPSPIYAPAPIYYSAPTVHTTESTTTVPQPPTTITNSNILSLIIIQDSLTAF